MNDWLIEGFEYDAWANAKWEAAIPRLGKEERAAAILSHIRRAQVTWFERVAGTTSVNPSIDWPVFLREADLDEAYDYHDKAGNPRTRTLRQIVLHVLNHGTYHRGHLRGLYDDAPLDQIPDTDIVYYLLEK